MPNINITVADKIATNMSPGVPIVCGNSDYTITFSFDAEWATQSIKTARYVFTRDGKVMYTDVAFSGSVAAVPVLSGVLEVYVGVYAGDLHTTTPARVFCARSILCGGGTHDEPPEDIYNQILEVCNQIAGASASHIVDNNNPHGVTASQVGARPSTWTPTAAEVGATPASHAEDKNNPHGVTAEQVGARPNTWTPTASDVGATPASHANDKNNPHGVTASQVGALPKAGGTMSGYLNYDGSNGLSWTTADGTIIKLRPYSPDNVFQITMQNPDQGVGQYGAVSIYTDGSWTFKYPEKVRNAIGAATSGYGWGETNGVNVPYGDPDYVDRTCIFVASQGNIPAGGVWLGQYIASGADGDMTARAYTGPVGSICKRYKLNGEWQPWEWVNPPMAEGVQYRTTERYKDKPVYAKAVSLNLAGAGNKYVAVDDAMTEVVSFTAYMQNGIYAYDLAFNSNIINCFVNVDSGNFFVNSTDMPGWTARAIVKYIK